MELPRWNPLTGDYFRLISELERTILVDILVVRELIDCKKATRNPQRYKVRHSVVEDLRSYCRFIFSKISVRIYSFVFDRPITIPFSSQLQPTLFTVLCSNSSFNPDWINFSLSSILGFLDSYLLHICGYSTRRVAIGLLFCSNVLSHAYSHLKENNMFLLSFSSTIVNGTPKRLAIAFTWWSQWSFGDGI